MPVNAALLVCALSILIDCAVIGSDVAFTAITATATIATMFSYLIPIVARHTVGRKTFRAAEWNLGRWSLVLGIVAGLYIMLLFCVLLLPQEYPITSVWLLRMIVVGSAIADYNLQQETLNYAPVCIGIVTIVSLVGWVLPFGLGGRYWFTGPKRTIEEEVDERSGPAWTAQHHGNMSKLP